MPIRQVIYLGIIILCVGFMVFQLIRRRLEGLTSILFRLTGGVVGILCANAILGMFAGAPVGINPFSLALLGGLGAPGFILLYLLSNIPV